MVMWGFYHICGGIIRGGFDAKGLFVAACWIGFNAKAGGAKGFRGDDGGAAALFHDDYVDADALGVLGFGGRDASAGGYGDGGFAEYGG